LALEKKFLCARNREERAGDRSRGSDALYGRSRGAMGVGVVHPWRPASRELYRRARLFLAQAQSAA
jgi:hypothetical protein